MRIIVGIVVNAVAIWAATFLPGVHVTVEGTMRTIVTWLVIGLIFGVVNLLVKPVAKLLALPVTLITLGLFALVVNALMIELVAWISRKAHFNFTIDNFGWAILAAIVVSVVSAVLNLVLADD